MTSNQNWKLVPAIPTEEMDRVGQQVSRATLSSPGAIYAAMVEAAPKPSALGSSPVSILSGDDVGTARSRSLEEHERIFISTERAIDAYRLGYEAGKKVASLPREGWKLVPEDPDEDMLAFGDEAMIDTNGNPDNWLVHCRNVWQAMYRHAPLSQVSAERERSSSQSTDGESK